MRLVHQYSGTSSQITIPAHQQLKFQSPCPAVNSAQHSNAVSSQSPSATIVPALFCHAALYGSQNRRRNSRTLTLGAANPATAAARSPDAARRTDDCAAEDGSTPDAGDEQHVCMVCKEGYHLQPSELLGTYVFCEQIAVEDVGGAAPLEVLAAPQSAGFVLSSVSHFSLIHIKCHMAARRADAVLRDPQGEWDGATLRNSGNRANNLLPIASPLVSDAAYAAAVATFCDQLPGAVSFPISPAQGEMHSSVTVVAVAVDVACLLRNFALQESFSADTCGGGRASNACLIMPLLQLGRHLMATADAATVAQLANAVAELGADIPVRLSRVPFRLALALLIQSPQEWDAARRTVILHTLHAHLQPGPSFAAVAPPSSSAVSETEAGVPQLWREAVPAVRLFGMVDQLQRRLKVTDGGAASWQAAMNQRLSDLSAVDSIAMEMLGCLEKAEAADSALELFEAFELQPVVITGSITTCEDFMAAAAAPMRK